MEDRINDIDNRLTNLETMHKVAFFVIGVVAIYYFAKSRA